MSQFFGNRLLKNPDPFFIRAYMCPPPLSDEDHEKLKTEYAATQKTKDDEIAKLKADLEKHNKQKDPAADDPDLLAQAKKAREEKDKKNNDSKSLEAALRFNMGSKDWLKTNASLLPKDIEGIFTASERETYDSAIEKDAALKSGIIQSFFQVQENLDLLTASQKSALEDFLKLTKNGKQEKAQQLYDSIFEPTFEMLKRIKKAQHLNNGTKNQSDGEKALADRMKTMSRKHYLGEKSNA